MAFALVLGLIGLLLVGVPVGIALALMSVGYLLFEQIPAQIVIQQMYQGTNIYVLLAVPLFMAAGALMNEGAITERLVELCDRTVGHIRGGLAHVNIMVSMVFAEMSGSSLADSAGVGRALIPEMKRKGYSADFSGAVTAASAVIGPIIPPSVPMVLAAGMAGVSVGKMFLGGAIPGVVFGILMMIVSSVIARKRNYPTRPRATVRQWFAAFFRAFIPLFMPVIMLGGIFAGIFTPTEGAAVAVAYALLIGILIYKTLGWGKIKAISREVAIQTAAIMFIVAAAQAYGYVLTMERVPYYLFRLFSSVTSDPQIILLMIVFIMIFIGSFMSTTPTLLITVPILIPIVNQVGYDPLHFFVVVTLAACIGTITPPVGLTLYVASAIAERPAERVFIEMLPFVVMLVLTIVACIFFPSIITWLPNLIMPER